MQRILRDKPSQLAVGLFVATFVHAILALREVSDNGDGAREVPGISVVTAFMLVLLSIAVLVVPAPHRTVAPRLRPHRARRRRDPQGPRPRVSRPGPRQFIPAGAPLFRVHGQPVGLDEARVYDALMVGPEPTLDQDVAYGVRPLVDVAERALSESPFLDPTTAVQAIDRLHDLLRQLVRRPFSDGVHRDDAGEVRLTVRSMTWEAFVRLAFDELRLAGAESPQVTRRLRAALTDLRSVVPPDRVEVLDSSSTSSRRRPSRP